MNLHLFLLCSCIYMSMKPSLKFHLCLLLCFRSIMNEKQIGRVCMLLVLIWMDVWSIPSQTTTKQFIALFTYYIEKRCQATRIFRFVTFRIHIFVKLVIESSCQSKFLAEHTKLEHGPRKKKVDGEGKENVTKVKKKYKIGPASRAGIISRTTLDTWRQARECKTVSEAASGIN